VVRSARCAAWLCVIAFLVLFAGCSSGVNLPVANGDPNAPVDPGPDPDPDPDPGPAPGPDPEPPSFSADIMPTFIATCAFAGCHAGGPRPPAEGLDLRADTAYAHLVNVASSEVPSLMRVTPGDSDNSYLIHKLEGTQTVGSRMPDGGPPLSAAFIASLREWIDAGAPNN